MAGISYVIEDIIAVYDEMKKKYISVIDTTKKEKKIGGTYYGRTELFSTSGIQFDKSIGYEHYGGYYGVNRYYDFVFKVGGEHGSEFSKVKKNFLEEFNEKIHEILDEYGFEENKCFFGDDEYQIVFHQEVSYGTNFSTYCGMQIKIRKKDEAKEFRLKKEWIRSII